MLTLLMLAATLTAWMAFSYATLSLMEYVLHRWVMHRRPVARIWFLLRGVFERHVLLHHGVYYPGRKFVGSTDPAARHIGISASAIENLALLCPIWLPLYLFSSLGAAVFIGCATAHAFVWTAIHSEMHEPANRWFSKLSVYKWLRSYHETHHRRPKFNFNVVCPLFDHVFGTYLGPMNGPIM